MAASPQRRVRRWRRPRHPRGSTFASLHSALQGNGNAPAHGRPHLAPPFSLAHFLLKMHSLVAGWGRDAAFLASPQSQPRFVLAGFFLLALATAKKALPKTKTTRSVRALWKTCGKPVDNSSQAKTTCGPIQMSLLIRSSKSCLLLRNDIQRILNTLLRLSI